MFEKLLFLKPALTTCFSFLLLLFKTALGAGWLKMEGCMSEVGRFGWAFSGGWGSGVCAAWLDLGRTGRLTSDPMTPHPKAFC